MEIQPLYKESAQQIGSQKQDLRLHQKPVSSPGEVSHSALQGNAPSALLGDSHGVSVGVKGF